MIKTADFVRRLKRHGFWLEEHGKRHDLYIDGRGHKVRVPRHADDLGKGLYFHMLRDAGLRDD